MEDDLEPFKITYIVDTSFTERRKKYKETTKTDRAVSLDRSLQYVQECGKVSKNYKCVDSYLERDKVTADLPRHPI